MGYLINPIGFRLGHSTSWVDTWFSYKDAYPEFLHFVLKIRIFLGCYLNSFPSEEDLDWSNKNVRSLFRSAVLYSHFKIIFNLSSVYISLFIYPGKFWDFFTDYKKPPYRFSNILNKQLFKSLDLNKTPHSLGKKYFNDIFSNKFLLYKKNNNRNKFNDKFFRKLNYDYFKNSKKNFKFINSLRKRNFFRFFKYPSFKRFFWKHQKGFHFLLLFFFFLNLFLFWIILKDYFLIVLIIKILQILIKKIVNFFFIKRNNPF